MTTTTNDHDFYKKKQGDLNDYVNESWFTYKNINKISLGKRGMKMLNNNQILYAEKQTAYKKKTEQISKRARELMALFSEELKRAGKI